MAIVATMACGCRIETDGLTAPVCAEHRETRVSVVRVPMPRITAVGCKATGPLVTQKE